MDRDLAAFLESRTADLSQQVVWRGGQHRLSLRVYITADTPPDAFVLAGRALVIDGARVLVLRNPDGEHVLPGGRREPGETAADAVRREVLEETGWSISRPTAFAVLHFHYETPEPVDVGRVIYPDFLWHVFVATPRTFDATARQADDYELGATFRDIAEVLEQPLEPYQRILLEAVARTEGPRGHSQLALRKLLIRPARGDEARALSELARRSKASWGYSEALMKSFQAELTLTALDLTEVLVVEVGGAPGGFYSLQPVSEARAELGHLFVEPTMLRRGLGRLMIADALRRAGARGFRVLEIQGDPNAAQFYAQVGATRVGERESDSVPGRMLPLFEIALP